MDEILARRAYGYARGPLNILYMSENLWGINRYHIRRHTRMYRLHNTE